MKALVILLSWVAFCAVGVSAVDWGNLDRSTLPLVSTSAFRDLTPKQLHQIPIPAWNSIRLPQLLAIASHTCMSINESHVSQLDGILLNQWLGSGSTTCDRDIPKRVMRSLSLRQLYFLNDVSVEIEFFDPQIFREMTPEMAAHWPMRQCPSFTRHILREMSIESTLSLRQYCIVSMHRDVWGELNSSQINMMPPFFFKQISPSLLPAGYIRSLSEDNLRHLGGLFCASMRPDQQIEFTDAQLTLLSGSCTSGLGDDFCSILSTKRIESLSDDAAGAIRCSLSGAVLSKIDEAQLMRLKNIGFYNVTALELKQLLQKHGETLAHTLTRSAAVKLLTSPAGISIGVDNIKLLVPGYSHPLPSSQVDFFSLTALKVALFPSDPQFSSSHSELWAQNMGLDGSEIQNHSAESLFLLEGLRSDHVRILHPAVVCTLHTAALSEATLLRIINNLSGEQWTQVPAAMIREHSAIFNSPQFSATSSLMPVHIREITNWASYCHLWSRLTAEQRTWTTANRVRSNSLADRTQENLTSTLK